MIPPCRGAGLSSRRIAEGCAHCPARAISVCRVIPIDRVLVPPPESLNASRVAEARGAAAAHFRASDAHARQSLHRFEPLFAGRDVREALDELFSNKCAFCESPLGGVTAGDFHHFRPKQGAVDPRTGETSRRHYWWLAYEWENLYLACVRCSRSAGTRFPVDADRARSGAKGAELLKEHPLLLDPCAAADDPAESLLFQLDGTVEAGDPRGAQTIETFSLNRSGLVTARLDRIRTVASWLQHGMTDPGEVQDSAAPFTGMVRQLIGALVDVRTSDVRGSDIRVELTEQVVSASVRIVSAEIENFRAIESLLLQFESEPDSWTMLLGDNGHGKSSVLQALAIALMNGSQRSRLDSSPYLRHGARRGRIVVQLSDRSVREVKFSAEDRRFRGTPAKQLILAGYGAYRAPGRGAPRRTVAPRVNSILSPYVRLISPTEWLLQLDRTTFDAAGGALRRLLLDDEGYFQRRSGRVLYRRPDVGPMGLDDLSAGYRSTVALAVDLMSYMLTRWGDLQAAEGIVLIDELGTHLHPRWQMKVVGAFRQAFPRIQFIATTHDPLCLRGLRDGEVIVLRRDEQRRVFAEDDLPPVSHLYVDQLLTSDYFGLGSTRDPELEDQFAEYYDLLSVRRPDPRQRARLRELQQVLADRRQFGRTARERLVFEAADRALARRATERDPETRALIKAEAERVIEDLWLESEA